METTSIPLDSSAFSSHLTSNQTSHQKHRSPELRRKILLHDPDMTDGSVIEECLPHDVFDVTYCRNPEEAVYRALEEGDSSSFDLMLWGLTAPFDQGLARLQQLRDRIPDLRVMLLAPQEALAHAAAIKQANVESFILKPLHAVDVRGGIERALRRPRLSDVTRAALAAAVLPSVTNERPAEDGIELGMIGSSPEMRKVFQLIRKVGPSNCNVLVTGESGTGKEMVASAIHKTSDRHKKPFIAINCAAIPRELLESELFGHAKGAFTGATTARKGLFEEAHEGTILLDEIGDLPLSLQAKILRLLQTRQVKPLGQNAVKEVDVRIVSATHKNLKHLIQKGEFREDLYYRLNVMPIHLPALRDRKDDILLLAEYFLRRNTGRKGAPPLSLTKRACAKLQSLPWKGNVRELENVIERAMVLSNGQQVTDDEIMSEDAEPIRVSTEDLFNSNMSLKDIEREYIKYVLGRTGNRKEAATRILGIDRKTLYRKEKIFGIRSTQDLN